MTRRIRALTLAGVLVAVGTGVAFALSGRFDRASVPLPGTAGVQGHDVPIAYLKAAQERGHTKAPDFTLLTLTGENWNLADHASRKPVLLFFVEKDCPCCVGAKPFMERVRNAYEGQFDMLGIVDSDPAKAIKWSKNVTAMFPIVSDPSQKVIGAYGVKRGAYAILVGPGPKIKQVYPGYSASMMQNLGDQIASMAGVKPVQIDVSGAPERLASGCDFPTVSKI